MSNREKLERLRKRTIAAALKVTKKKESSSDEDEPESRKKDDAEELLGNAKQRQAFYGDQDPIRMKTIDEIKKEAMISFQLTKDRLKIQNEAKKYGQLRPICADVIQEVKEHEEQRIAELRRRKLGAVEHKQATWSQGPNLQLGAHTKSTTTADSDSEHNQKLFRVTRRHDLLPTKMAAPFTIHSIPAQPFFNDDNALPTESERLTTAESFDKRRPASASALTRSDLSDTDSVILRAEATSSWDNEQGQRPYSARCSFMRTATSDSNDPTRRVFSRPTMSRMNTGITLRSGSIFQAAGTGTSGFVPRVVDQDEKIMKALKAKEELLQAKEEKILKRIQDKEESAHNRHVQQLVQERMKGWISLIVLLTRMKYVLINLN